MRVVALLPAATDIVCALGAAETLVGVTHECDSRGLAPTVPRVTASTVASHASAAAIDERVRELHASGTPLFELNEERIREARPDLILTQSLCEVCAVHENDVRALAQRLSPSPRILTLGAGTLDAVLEDVQLVAAAIGRSDEGAELGLGLRARMRAVHSTLKAAHAPRPRVAVIEWTEPLYAAGHWVPDLIRRAGGTDVLAAAGAHSATCTIEAVRDARPDVLILAPCGYALDRAADEGREFLGRAEMAWALECSVWAVDANTLISRPGPGLVDAIEVMARIFNAPLFSPLGEGRAVRLV
ncbi:MAG: ABC transporter substrate-binding protein [Gemmatimonadaceae bacterium]